MVLPNDLISKFVKITRDDKKTKNETTVYGTVVEVKENDNGTKTAYVRFDGAAENQLTPAITTVDAEVDERVSVLLKDHTATVTGNISSPAARVETVGIVTQTVEAQNGKISNIEADNVEINKTLTAHKASMKEIEADNVEIKETLTAQKASIDKLETNKLSAEDAQIKFANIDFANIGEAAIEKLFTDSGIIGDLVMSDGHVTGKLVGVTIIGDLIEGGTVKAEKLVIRGTDGLYYKLNTNGATVSSEQTDYNSLNGKIITAKSITAEKINVDDLVAFGATIGGFHITKDSIYSGAKSSVNNTTRGIYQDTDGQFTIGDANNFLKFYKDTDGTYKLAISASTITFGDSGKSVEEAITEVQNGVDDIKIGGRNLLLNSSFSNGATSWGIGLNTTVVIEADSKYGNCIVFSHAEAGDNNRNRIFQTPFANGSSHVAGEMYTLSFFAKSLSSSTSIKAGFVGNLTEFTISNVWTRYTCSYTASSAGSLTLYAVEPGVTAYIALVKLEHGNKATDWTPAPEDIENELAELGSRVKIEPRKSTELDNLEDGVVYILEDDPTLDEIEKEIDNASKTAKNFLEYDTTNGLQIGNKTGGSWSGFRAQITAGAYNILNAAGVVLASYGEKLIELGKNATDAIIKLCGGKGQIEYVTDEDSGTNYLQVYSDRVRIKSRKMSSVYSMYTNDSTRWEKSAVNVSPNEIELYASECIDPTLPEHVDGWHITRVGIKSGKVNVETPGPVTFKCEGVYDEYGKIMSIDRGSSGIWSYSKWSDGRVELDGVYAISDLACTTALGTWYRTAVFQPSSFPFTVYNPKLTANYESEGYGAMLWATTTTSASKPPSYYLIRPTSATIVSGKIIFHVTGTWS